VLDAAAQVLAGSKEPLHCKALIEAMAKKGLWTGPGGKTPHATFASLGATRGHERAMSLAGMLRGKQSLIGF
jgi:hypothetical protein